MNNFDKTISFFNEIVSIYLRIREFHFNTHIEAEHNLTNSLMPSLMDYADSVMENQMGINDSRPGMDIIRITPCTESTLVDTLKYLSNEISNYRETLDETTQIGIINILDDFAQDVNKWIYLSRNK